MNLRAFGIILVSGAIALCCTTASAVLTGEYLFENNLLDTSGSVRNGTHAVSGVAGGTPTFVAGLYPGSTAALQLNSNGPSMPNQAAAQSVLLPTSTNFIRNAPGATLMAWVRLDGVDAGATNFTRTIVSINNGDTAANGGAGSARATLQIVNSPNNATGSPQVRALGRRANENSANATSGTTFLTLGQTYFLAGVFDYLNGGIRVYINGTQVGSASPAWSTNSDDTANLVAELGSVATPSAAAQEYWPGVIDGVRIFNTALTSEQIMALYLDYSDIPDPNVAGDTDGDGVVEAEDLTPIRQNYRLSGKIRTQGDLTGDTIVDWLDFRQWKTAYLDTLPGGGSLAGIDLNFLEAGQVPEPSTLALMAWLSVGGLRRRRRR